MKKYGKEILAQDTHFIDGECFTVCVLDDESYYNIHVIDERFNNSEYNTLRLQEPKANITLEQVTSKPYLLARMMEYVLWRKCYRYDFSVEYEGIEE